MPILGKTPIDRQTLAACDEFWVREKLISSLDLRLGAIVRLSADNASREYRVIGQSKTYGWQLKATKAIEEKHR